MDLDLDWAQLLGLACGLGDSVFISEGMEQTLKMAVREVLMQDTDRRQYRAMLEWGFSKYKISIERLNQLYPQIDFEDDYAMVLFGATLDRVRYAFLNLCRQGG